ncbi:hypothetical protein GALMADRAFT_282185 [Galerina marginata CBS 339.88]|uniref:Uncharacterized protein n=1 Tax=Galerina marginata (strain CBS 339.88) TaxID=685588 RepID=A0A067SUC4_GALM3|nr:hypothetical protein GALMADRAFT_282185 [Galerina marginata CBS 339.88]
MKTPANNHSLGIVSEIRSFSIVTGFGDHDEDSDVEDEYGEEENTIAKVIAKYLPGILKLLMTDARGLQHFHIEDQTDPLSVGYDWMSLPPELRSTVRALLIFRTLKRLDLQNFTEVPNDFFHQTNVAHLITKNFLSRETELRFDDSPSGSSFDGMQLTFGAVETLDTDQYFPIHRMVDMSRNHPSRPSQAHFLKNIKLFVWNEDDFNQVIHLLHAAYLAEDLFYPSL